jgi:hypothetical protein
MCIILTIIITIIVIAVIVGIIVTHSTTATNLTIIKITKRPDSPRSSCMPGNQSYEHAHPAFRECTEKGHCHDRDTTLTISVNFNGSTITVIISVAPSRIYITTIVIAVLDICEEASYLCH